MVTYGRDAMIEEVWKIVLDDIVYIPLHHQMIVWAMRDNLEIAVYPVQLSDLPRGAVQVGNRDWPALRRRSGSFWL